MNEVTRPHLIKAYTDNMVTYLSQTSTLSQSEIRRKVEVIVKERFKDIKTTNIVVNENGDASVKTEAMWDFLNKHTKHVITPGGSIYKPATEKIALVKQMIIDRLAERAVVKKQMLLAKAAGNTSDAKRFHYQQATIKIGINSLPGGMGSPYNCFYDRGGYNAITSSARALIAQSYTVCEQLLGGNFAWYNEEAVINHIVLNINHGASEEDVNKILKTYKMKPITKKQLLDYIVDTIKIYKPSLDKELLKRLVDSLRDYQVSYLYYLGNLRHIIWGNDEIFRPWVLSLMNITNLDFTREVNPDDLYKIDGDLVAVLTATYSNLIKGLQFYDLPKERKDLACKFVIIAEHFQKQLDNVSELFRVFVHYPTNIPLINDKKHMWRNTTIASDTDSVLFTSKDWMDWMTGDVLKDSAENQQISSLVVYWLTKATEFVLKKFSIQLGATGEDIHRMKMKNEFKYSSFILFDIKKTYAGVVTIQEGVVLPVPEADIKGGNLRSSSIPAQTTAFIKEMIIEDILKASIDNKLSAVKLIKKVVDYENKIRDSILSGSTEYLKVTSINLKETYVNHLSSAYFYYLAWNEIFGMIYEEIRLPTKPPVLPLLTPTPAFDKYLQDTNKKVAKLFNQFLLKYNKFPNSIAIADTVNRIPPELLPIIDTRSIIYHNVRPLYLTLNSLGIETGFEKRKLLLSDIYPNT